LLHKQKDNKGQDMNKHDELRNKLDILNEMARSEAFSVVTEILKYIMDSIQPERSKREDSEYGAKCDFGILKSEMRCSEHCGDTVRDK
jgi:hypothetical protein